VTGGGTAKARKADAFTANAVFPYRVDAPELRFEEKGEKNEVCSQVVCSSAIRCNGDSANYNYDHNYAEEGGPPCG
jgi:hypothetical protein